MDLRITESKNTNKVGECPMCIYETGDMDDKVKCVFCRVVYRCRECIDAISTMNLNNIYCKNCLDTSFNVSCILPDKLYLSDFHTSKNYPLLKKHGIKQILTIGKELPEHKTREFETLYISLDDAPWEQISEYFDKAHDFIKQGNTLVHCYAGKSRSATLVISYLMKYLRLSFDRALHYCRSARRIVDPNSGFKEQLRKYEKKLKLKPDGKRIKHRSVVIGIFKMEL